MLFTQKVQKVKNLFFFPLFPLLVCVLVYSFCFLMLSSHASDYPTTSNSTSSTLYVIANDSFTVKGLHLTPVQNAQCQLIPSDNDENEQDIWQCFQTGQAASAFKYTGPMPEDNVTFEVMKHRAILLYYASSPDDLSIDELLSSKQQQSSTSGKQHDKKTFRVTRRLDEENESDKITFDLIEVSKMTGNHRRYIKKHPPLQPAALLQDLENKETTVSQEQALKRNFLMQNERIFLAQTKAACQTLVVELNDNKESYNKISEHQQSDADDSQSPQQKPPTIKTQQQVSESRNPAAPVKDFCAICYDRYKSNTKAPQKAHRKAGLLKKEPQRYDKDSDLVKTDCHHNFHRKCLRTWFANSYNEKCLSEINCPYCRSYPGPITHNGKPIKIFLPSNAPFLLCNAVIKNEVKLVQALIHYGADPNQQTKKPLHTSRGGKATAEATSYPSYCTPILPAIHADKPNVDIIKILLQSGARIDRPISQKIKSTPLLYVLTAKKTASLKAVVEYSSEKNVTKEHLNKCLALTVGSENLEQTQLLLEHVDFDASNLPGDCFLLLCTENNLSMIKLLIEHNARIDKTTDSGATPLQIACCFNRVEVVKILLENGVNVNIQSATKEVLPPLHHAIYARNDEILKILLDHPNIDVNNPDEDGVTPLLLATAMENYRAIELLLQHPDINVNCTDSKNISPLTSAIILKDYESIKLLVEAGADIVIDPDDVPILDSNDSLEENYLTYLMLVKSRLPIAYPELKREDDASEAGDGIDLDSATSDHDSRSIKLYRLIENLFTEAFSDEDENKEKPETEPSK